MEKRVLETLKKAFRPEFLNRIDENVVFDSLGEKELTKIVKLMIAQLSKRLSNQDIHLSLTPKALKKNRKRRLRSRVWCPPDSSCDSTPC
ncbi:hypothetical protein [Brochothrix campestris]